MTATTSAPTTARKVTVPRTYDTWAWLFMRWSGLLLIPLAWIHVIIQDVLVGVHRIDLDYVALRWSLMGWRVYDMALLAFAFAHGMNGLRYIVGDYVRNQKIQRMLNWLIFIAWLVITAIGAVAVIGGVQTP